MKAERALIAFHSGAVLLALAAALLWPRPGQTAVLVPLAHNDLGTVLRWADAADAPLVSLDSASGRVVARVPENRALIRALAAGILPIAIDARVCEPGEPT